VAKYLNFLNDDMSSRRERRVVRQ